MKPLTDRKGEVGTPEHREAIRRLVIIAGILAVGVGLTYVVPFASSLRPWVPGDDPPMKRLYTFDWSRGISGSASGETDAPLKGAIARASLAEGLGESLADNLGTEVGIEQPGRKASDRKVEKSGTDGAEEKIEIDPSELKGVVRSIEDPSGEALDFFYRSLLETARDRKITRIAHWGDSTIAADDVTGTLRRRFQTRFGDSGHGFMLAGKGTMPYRHKDIDAVQSGQWKQQMVIHRSRSDGRYGYGGVVLTTFGGGSARYSTVEEGPTGREVSSFEVYFGRHPSGGTLNVAVDSGKPVAVSTEGGTADRPEDGFYRIDVTPGYHSFELTTEGTVSVYGVALENDRPGVVYDSLGIVGARAQRLQNFDDPHFTGQVSHRSPDLLVIAFGGNESGDTRMRFDIYRENLRKTVALVRSGSPEASCLLLAPLDQGEVDSRGRVRTIPTIPGIVDAQREVAAEVGCAFFDTFQAMGGEGAMERWYQSNPRLGWGDYRHATPAGYEVIGNMIYKAMLAGFAEFLNVGQNFGDSRQTSDETLEPASDEDTVE